MAKRMLLTEGEVGAEGLVPEWLPGSPLTFLHMTASCRLRLTSVLNMYHLRYSVHQAGDCLHTPMDSCF